MWPAVIFMYVFSQQNYEDNHTRTFVKDMKDLFCCVCSIHQLKLELVLKKEKNANMVCHKHSYDFDISHCCSWRFLSI